MKQHSTTYKSSWVLNLSIILALGSVFILEGIHASFKEDNEDRSEESLLDIGKNRPVILLLSGQNVDLQNADYYKNLDVIKNEIHQQSPRVFVTNSHQSQWRKLCRDLKPLKNPVLIVSVQSDNKITNDLKNCLNKDAYHSQIKWRDLKSELLLEHWKWQRDLASIGED